MTPKEIVKAAIFNQGPERLPARFGCFGVDDTSWLPVKAAAKFQPRHPGEDEWGCGWAKTAVPNMGQVKGHPLADVAALAKCPHPDYDDDSRYTDCAAALAQAEKDGKYMVAGIFMVLFERMHSLYGFENTLCDLRTDRAAMARLADFVVDVHLQFVRNIQRRFGSRVQAFGMSDDWGTQQAAFVSFDLWMDFFFPRYKKLFDAMHEGGQDVWVHSCGKVNEIVEGYVRAGVNVVNLQQPRALGIAEMGKRFRGRIAFESLCDIQHTLPTNSRREVDKDVRDLAKHWLAKTGGFVFSDYGDSSAIGVTDPAIKRYMYEQFSAVSEKLYGKPLPAPVTAKPA
jgi:uroporphyrinogen decarboxylase